MFQSFSELFEDKYKRVKQRVTVDEDYVKLGFRLTTITFSSRFNIQFTEHFKETVNATKLQPTIREYDQFMNDIQYDKENVGLNKLSVFEPQKIMLKKGVRKFRYSQVFPLFKIDRRYYLNREGVHEERKIQLKEAENENDIFVYSVKLGEIITTNPKPTLESVTKTEDQRHFYHQVTFTITIIKKDALDAKARYENYSFLMFKNGSCTVTGLTDIKFLQAISQTLMKGMIYQGYVEFLIHPKDLEVAIQDKVKKGKRCTQCKIKQKEHVFMYPSINDNGAILFLCDKCMHENFDVQQFIADEKIKYFDVKVWDYQYICMTKLLPENAFSICQIFNVIDYRAILQNKPSYTMQMFEILDDFKSEGQQVYDKFVFEANKREKDTLEKTQQRLSNVLKQQERRVKKIQRQTEKEQRRFSTEEDKRLRKESKEALRKDALKQKLIKRASKASTTSNKTSEVDSATNISTTRMSSKRAVLDDSLFESHDEDKNEQDVSVYGDYDELPLHTDLFDVSDDEDTNIDLLVTEEQLDAEYALLQSKKPTKKTEEKKAKILERRRIERERAIRREARKGKRAEDDKVKLEKFAKQVGDLQDKIVNFDVSVLQYQMKDFTSVIDQYREAAEFITETRDAIKKENQKLDELRAEYEELLADDANGEDEEAFIEAKEEYDAFIEDSVQIVSGHEETLEELVKEQRIALDKIIEIIVYMNEKFPREIHIKKFCKAVIASTKNVDVKYDQRITSKPKFNIYSDEVIEQYNKELLENDQAAIQASGQKEEYMKKLQKKYPKFEITKRGSTTCYTRDVALFDQFVEIVEKNVVLLSR